MIALIIQCTKLSTRQISVYVITMCSHMLKIVRNMTVYLFLDDATEALFISNHDGKEMQSAQ